MPLQVINILAGLMSLNIDGNTIFNLLVIAGALITNYVAISNRLVKLETQMQMVYKKVIDEN